MAKPGVYNAFVLWLRAGGEVSGREEVVLRFSLDILSPLLDQLVSRVRALATNSTHAFNLDGRSSVLIWLEFSTPTLQQRRS